MNKSLKYLSVILFIVCGRLPNISAQANNKDSAQKIHLADPAMIYYHGTYYLYGTVEENANEGFLVYTSKET